MAYLDIVSSGTVLHPDATAVSDQDTENLATHAADPSAHGLGITWEEKYLARGLTRSGLTVGQAGWFFEEFADISRWQKLSGVVSATGSSALVGGVAEIDIPGPVLDDVEYESGDATYGSAPVVRGVDRFYLAGRICVSSIAGTATDSAILGLMYMPVTQCVLVGYLSAVDAGKFMVFIIGPGGAGFTTSSVAIDNAWHNIECWSDGTSYGFSVDDESPIVYVPPSMPTAGLSPFLGGGRGNGAGPNQTVQFDKFLVVFPQAA